MPSALQTNMNAAMPKPKDITESEVDQENPLGSVAGYTPNEVQMEDTESVESRVRDIVKDDGKLMQVARTNANQQMNRRGVLNSSMAIGAGQRAVIETATPIATEDARSSLSVKQGNQNARNTAGQFNASEINKGRGQVYSGNQEIRSIRESGEQQRLNTQLGIEGESRLVQERGEIEKQLQTADGEIRARLIARQGEIDAELRNLQVEHDSRLQAEKALIDEQLLQAEGGVKERLIARQGEIDTELENVKNAHLQTLANQKARIDLMLQNAAAEDAKELEQIKGAIDREIANIGAGATLQAARIKADAEMEQIKVQGLIEAAIQRSDQAHEANIKMMDGEQAKEQLALKAQFEQTIQTSINAAEIMGSHSEGVSEILNNPKLKPHEKTGMIQKLNEQTFYNLSIISASDQSDTAVDYSQIFMDEGGVPAPLTQEELDNLGERWGGAGLGSLP